ncbi:hypothetical protein BAUCODRAFT_121727 [Baudoinia panamericana UAMH 10762]|uniref:Uncharacterized protein n=1 Tax=Baudoinia panamericana (strain UAMH 10762) TaxID=717646 RepID=M2MKK7_BAUPA|nr:uncharacterized protein BAUCODRAFT_121727 [Baudoinia panamericana UAMH 10762]EMC97226.1 hypothetical protein BAUCODRAFT_121727 [Baudoinia panamericana UAMH 10762]
MISVLLLVFGLQLAIHLLNTIGAQAINELLWYLFTRLPTSQSSDAKENAKLRSDVVRLNREMRNTSAQDDFAKWARLRRDHDKAKDKYDKQAQSLESFRNNFNRAVSSLRWLSTQGLQFFCNFYYSKSAMYWLPHGWFPYQVEWILSFPSAPLGSISINVWAIACASIIGMVSEGVRASLTLRQGKVIEGSNKGAKIRMDPISGAKEKKEL